MRRCTSSLRQGTNFLLFSPVVDVQRSIAGFAGNHVFSSNVDFFCAGSSQNSGFVGGACDLIVPYPFELFAAEIKVKRNDTSTNEENVEPEEKL